VTRGTTASSSAPHAAHDRLLIASSADPDLTASERRAADDLIASCADCRALAADLRTFSTVAASDLPRPVRPRDFRITPDQARQARGSVFTRFLERLAAPGLGILQPVGGLAAALGLALIVLNGPLLGGMASSGAAPMQDNATYGAAAESAAGGAPAPSAAGSPGARPAGEPLQGAGSSPLATMIAPPTRDTAAGMPTFAPASPTQREGMTALDVDDGSRTAPVSVPMLAGVGLLVGGLLIIAARVLARRRLTV
jgi:hypothetical protein